MKHQKIDDKAHVWTILRGSDGRLHEELDPALLERINAGRAALESAEAEVIAAGRRDIDENRTW